MDQKPKSVTDSHDSDDLCLAADDHEELQKLLTEMAADPEYQCWAAERYREAQAVMDADPQFAT